MNYVVRRIADQCDDLHEELLEVIEQNCLHSFYGTKARCHAATILKLFPRLTYNGYTVIKLFLSFD